MTQAGLEVGLQLVGSFRRGHRALASVQQGAGLLVVRVSGLARADHAATAADVPGRAMPVLAGRAVVLRVPHCIRVDSCLFHVKITLCV